MSINICGRIMIRRVDVTIIVACYNERDSIASFLDSYRSQTVHAREFIIVDGGSRDGTTDIIQEFSAVNASLNIRLIVDPQCSRAFSVGPIARARNVAIERAQTDWVVSVDCGCVIEAGWLESITGPIAADPSLDVVYGLSRALDRCPLQKKFAAVFLSHDEISESFLPSSRNMAFKKSCWGSVGGYPEHTYTAEDTVFAQRLRKNCCRFHLAPDAIVYWDCPATLHEANKKYYRYALGEGWYFYAPLKYFFIALCCLLPVNFLLIPRHRLAPLLVYTTNWSRLAGYCSGMFVRLKGALSGVSL